MYIPVKNRTQLAAMALVGCATLLAPWTVQGTIEGQAPADTAMTMSGDSDGTVFKSLTVEAENRVQIKFDRPELLIDIDPSTAPGLTWGSSREVLDRTVPDLVSPYLRASAFQRSPYTARPWIQAYKQGPVVVFNTDLDGVATWKLMVVDSRGQQVLEMAGKKNPPKAIPWDGRAQDGSPAMPGLTYSFVLEAYDKAGNKRRFVGDGFQIPAYRFEGKVSLEFMVAGRDWQDPSANSGGHRSPLLLETASWINLTTGPMDPMIITATAGTFSEAESLGKKAMDDLIPLLPGGANRMVVITRMEPGSPEGGVLHIKRKDPEADLGN